MDHRVIETRPSHCKCDVLTVITNSPYYLSKTNKTAPITINTAPTTSTAGTLKGFQTLDACNNVNPTHNNLIPKLITPNTLYHYATLERIALPPRGFEIRCSVY